MAKVCQDKTFQNKFKLLVAQEIVKFNNNLEGPKSKIQDNPTFKSMQPMINLYLDKGKQPLEFSTIKVTPKRPHQDSTIEIL